MYTRRQHVHANSADPPPAAASSQCAAPSTPLRLRGGRYTQGESYVDLVNRVKPVIEAMQEVEGFLIIVAHQAIARVIHSYLTGSSLGQVPVLEMPLHTIYEYTPQPEGGCAVTSFEVPVPCRQLSFRDFVIAYDRLHLSGTISLNSINEATEAAEEEGEGVEA
jgi:broad specificity phosphatase PhoE